MRFELPTLKEEFDNKTKEIVEHNGTLDCELNLTLDAQQTWEDAFPELSKKIGLFDYVEQMKDIQIKDQATAIIALKIIYCFLLFDNKLSFREFVRMFTLSNTEYFDKLANTLTDILKAINKRNEDKKKPY